MSRSANLSRRTARLTLDRLESRLTPAGTVTVTQSGGVLTLTGTDDSEVVRLKQVGADITVTGESGTIIDGRPLSAASLR